MSSPSSAPACARRSRDAARGPARREGGFTLIELLVAVVVIGILSAVAVPVYLGVQNSAREAGPKTDLANAKTAIGAWAAANGGALPVQSGFDPSASGQGLVRYGWTQSADTASLVYTSPSSTTWCVLATSSSGKKWAISSTTQVSGGTSTSACPSSL